MSTIDPAAAAKYDAERDQTDFSPAQPDDATRIDNDGKPEKAAADEAAEVKHDGSHRMKH